MAWKPPPAAGRVQQVEAWSTLASEWGEWGRKVKAIDDSIDLGQGAPDEGNEHTCELACEVLKKPSIQQYSPPQGLPSVLEGLVSWYTAKYDGFSEAGSGEGIALGSDNFLVMTSSAEGIYTIFQSYLNPGEEVAMFEPFFPFFYPCVLLAGGVPVSGRLDPANGFEITEEVLTSVLTPKTKILLLNSPQNPTGHVFNEKEKELIARVLSKPEYAHIMVMSDEVYEVLTFPKGTDTAPIEHVPLCLYPGMWERTLTVSGASKLMGLTGWRVGWVYGPPALIESMKLVRFYTTYCAPAPLAEAVGLTLKESAAAIREGKPADHTSVDLTFGAGKKFYKAAEALQSAFESLGMKCIFPDGGYFMVVDISSSGKTDVEFCNWLLEEVGVLVLPLKLYYLSLPGGEFQGRKQEAIPNTMVRVGICKVRCEEAAGRIAALGARLQDQPK